MSFQLLPVLTIYKERLIGMPIRVLSEKCTGRYIPEVLGGRDTSAKVFMYL
jgi:hypothetical protein